MRLFGHSPGSGSFTLRRSLARRLSYDQRLAPELVDAMWQDADRLLYSSAPLQVKDRCAVAVHEHAGGALLVKRHTWGGFGRTLRSAWREASARRCARIALHLAEHGIPTPRPRAWLEHQIGPCGWRSYLVTDYVEGTSLYRSIRFGSRTPDELRHLAEQVAAIWQRLVEVGVSHNDFKPENFIVDDALKVWLIDFEKVRIGGNRRRRRQRHAGDVKNFLHVRSWHQRAAARQVFLEAFLRAPAGTLLDGLSLADLPQRDTDLSVLILCDGGADLRSTRRALDSVRDIADEIVLLAPQEDGHWDVLARTEPCGRLTGPSEWVLVLFEDEAVTPFLAKELQQRITDPLAAAAIRIAIERQYFGRTLSGRTDNSECPIRLFRRNCCSYSFVGGTFSVSANGAKTGRLSGLIEKCESASVAEYIERLNARTTAAASARQQAGQPARPWRAAAGAAATFCKTYLWRGLFRSGWAGLQIAALEAAFHWIEEAKLHQLASDFRAIQDEADTADADSGIGNVAAPAPISRRAAA